MGYSWNKDHIIKIISYTTVDNRVESADQINLDLRAIQDWADRWLVTFSAPKTETLTISNKRDQNQHPPLSLHNTVIKEVSSHKHLGVTLSNNLWWHSHVNDVFNRAMKRLDILSAFKFKLDRKALEHYYISFVRPVIEYADVVWAGAHDCDLAKLDRVQLRAMRIVTGATERSNIANLYEDTRWSKLKDRRLNHCLCWFYKITHNLAPQNLANIVPVTVRERSQYALRTANNISLIPARTENFRKSFFPSSISLWNSLSLELRNVPSYCSFNTALNKLLTTRPIPWYYVGDRWSNIHHARLRIGCSFLKSDLYNNLHVIDSPVCPCGHPVEDAYHFFFECSLFTPQRVALFDSLVACPTINLRTLLHGDDTLTNPENEYITHAVHTFIKDTNRFNSHYVTVP